MTDCTEKKKHTQRKVTHERTGCSVFPYDKLYYCWNDMIRRCSEQNHIAWKNYGGRGIRVCDEWKDLDEFMKWALGSGYERGLQIDRIDNESGYFPANCRWVSQRDNRNNTRTNVMTCGFGETKTLKEWSKDNRCVVAYKTLWHRIQVRNWQPEDAITLTSSPVARSKR